MLILFSVPDQNNSTQYVGGTDNTVPLDGAPSAVRGALSMIEQRMQDFLGMSSTFNEVLSAAYMEKQTMAVCFPPLFITRCNLKYPFSVSQ